MASLPLPIDNVSSAARGRAQQAGMRSAERNVIWEAYETARDDAPQLHAWNGSGFDAYTWDDWRRGAERAAVGLQALGIAPGERVGAVLTNTFEVCAAVLGTWLAGAPLLSFPALRRGQDAADYLAQLQRLCRQTDVRLLLLEERFLELLGAEELGVKTVGFAALPRAGALRAQPLGDEDIAFVQYSSGSVSDPKGCMLTLGAISAQERMLQERLGMDRSGGGAMWLPLSHDMGLFGCVLMSWTTGMYMALTPPERFLRKPRTWLEDMIAFDATIACAPNFALALAARWARTHPPAGRIRLDTIVLGGERIEWSTLCDIEQALGPYGLDIAAMVPAYGLAEATLAVSMKRRGAAPVVRSFDTQALNDGELVEVALEAGKRGSESQAGNRGSIESGSEAQRISTMVSCGPPVQGVRVRIDGGSAVGRICLSSPALCSGYLGDSEQTRRQIVDGEFRTADLGFMCDGELYVVGRMDDVILVGGRNVHTRDVELAVNACEGVRPGCATLVDLPGEALPQLVMVCEARADSADLPHVADGLASKTFDAAGVRINECVFVRPGALPKTPSGKIQRYRCRALVEGGSDAVLERVAL
jgi:acyl-CoA synthetase (AMP-forming)/AMP-acid ligase II